MLAQITIAVYNKSFYLFISTQARNQALCVCVCMWGGGGGGGGAKYGLVDSSGLKGNTRRDYTCDKHL